MNLQRTQDQVLLPEPTHRWPYTDRTFWGFRGCLQVVEGCFAPGRLSCSAGSACSPGAFEQNPSQAGKGLVGDSLDRPLLLRCLLLRTSSLKLRGSFLGAAQTDRKGYEQWYPCTKQLRLITWRGRRDPRGDIRPVMKQGSPSPNQSTFRAQRICLFPSFYCMRKGPAH